MEYILLPINFNIPYAISSAALLYHPFRSIYIRPRSNFRCTHASRKKKKKKTALHASWHTAAYHTYNAHAVYNRYTYDERRKNSYKCRRRRCKRTTLATTCFLIQIYLEEQKYNDRQHVFKSRSNTDFIEKKTSKISNEFLCGRTNDREIFV